MKQIWIERCHNDGEFWRAHRWVHHAAFQPSTCHLYGRWLLQGVTKSQSPFPPASRQVVLLLWNRRTRIIHRKLGKSASRNFLESRILLSQLQGERLVRCMHPDHHVSRRSVFFWWSTRLTIVPAWPIVEASFHVSYHVQNRRPKSHTRRKIPSHLNHNPWAKEGASPSAARPFTTACELQHNAVYLSASPRSAPMFARRPPVQRSLKSCRLPSVYRAKEEKRQTYSTLFSKDKKLQSGGKRTLPKNHLIEMLGSKPRCIPFVLLSCKRLPSDAWPLAQVRPNGVPCSARSCHGHEAIPAPAQTQTAGHFRSGLSFGHTHAFRPLAGCKYDWDAFTCNCLSIHGLVLRYMRWIQMVVHLSLHGCTVMLKLICPRACASCLASTSAAWPHIHTDEQCAHWCTNMYQHTCMNEYTPTHTHTHSHAYEHEYWSICLCTCIHTYTHTYGHTSKSKHTGGLARGWVGETHHAEAAWSWCWWEGEIHAPAHEHMHLSLKFPF